jgi:hypothetical protein
MKHSVPHDLDPEQAKKVMHAAWDSYSKRFADYSPAINWVNDAKAAIGFSAKGISIKGGIEVQAKAFELELEVPFLLKPFRGKAISVIEEEIKKWISKSKAGEV